MAVKKSFTCSICKKRFKTSDSMLLHIMEFCSGRVAMYLSPYLIPVKTYKSKRKLVLKEFSCGIPPMPISKICTSAAKPSKFAAASLATSSSDFSSLHITASEARSKRKLIHKEFSCGIPPMPISKICTSAVKPSTFAASSLATSTCDFSSLHITASEACSSSAMLLTSSIPSVTSSTFTSESVPLHPAPENYPTNIPFTSSIPSSIPSITPITLPSVFPPFYPTSNVTVVPYTSSVMPYTSSVVPYTSSVGPHTLSVVPFAPSIPPLIPSAFPSGSTSLHPTADTFTSSVTSSTGSFKFSASASTSGTYLANNDNQKIENIGELLLTIVENENAKHVTFETEVTDVEVSSLVGEHELEHPLFSKCNRDHNISASNPSLDRLSLSPDKSTQVLYLNLTPTNVNQEHENVEQIFEGTKNENVYYVLFDTENSDTEVNSSAQEQVIKHMSLGKSNLTDPESNIFSKKSSSSTDGSNDPMTAINSDVTDGGAKRESILQSDTAQMHHEKIIKQTTSADITKSNAQSLGRRKKSTCHLLETLFTSDQKASLTMETTSTTESSKNDPISSAHSLNESSKITFGAPATDAHGISGMVANSVSNGKISNRHSLENDPDTPCSDQKKFRAGSFKNDDVNVEADIISSSDQPNSRSYSNRNDELCALSTKCSQESERNEVNTPLYEPISSPCNDHEFCPELRSFSQSTNQNKRIGNTGNTELLSLSTKCSQEHERNEIETPLYEPISSPCNDDEFCPELSSFSQSTNQNKLIGNTGNTELLSLSTKCSQESERSEVKTPLYEPISSPCNDDEFRSEQSSFLQSTNNQNKSIGNTENTELSTKCSHESVRSDVNTPLYEPISPSYNDEEFYSEPSSLLPSTDKQTFPVGTTNFMDQKKKEHDLENDSDMLPLSDLWEFQADSSEDATQFLPTEDIWNSRVMFIQNCAPVFDGSKESEQNSVKNQQAAVSSDIEQIRSTDNRLDFDPSVLEDSGSIEDKLLAALWFLDSLEDVSF